MIGILSIDRTCSSSTNIIAENQGIFPVNYWWSGAVTGDRRWGQRGP